MFAGENTNKDAKKKTANEDERRYDKFKSAFKKHFIYFRTDFLLRAENSTR
jgi:hypothetical protein|tara:strand:+ start:7479 stop:7631 length:153 start_codon:yes stop_codon:yes gene_type:complete